MATEPTRPVPPPKELTETGSIAMTINDAYFDYDTAILGSGAQSALTADSAFLKEHSTIKFAIEGNCDERGSEEYNLGLGDRRATVAKKYLVNLGVAEDRIRTISYGKSHPLCTDHNEQCWQRNRHAHIVFGVRPQQ